MWSGTPPAVLAATASTSVLSGCSVQVFTSEQDAQVVSRVRGAEQPGALWQQDENTRLPEPANYRTSPGRDRVEGFAG